MTRSPVKIEKEVVNQAGYWIPTFWVFSIVVVGIGGFMLGGADTPPKLLASVKETLNNIFEFQEDKFVQVVDLKTFEPDTRNVDPDRVFTTSSFVVKNLSPTKLDYEVVEEASTTPVEYEVVTEELAIVGDLKLCSPKEQIPTYAVLINEVAWAGRENNTSEEWIELYNPQKEKIDLKGWQLIDQEASITILFEDQDTIEEYLLLRRILVRDDPEITYLVGSTQVDKVYTGVIQNNEESLYLFDSECNLIDEISDVGSNWSNIGGSSSPEYRTAERTNEDSWHTYSGNGESGVSGSPRTQNSKLVVISSSTPTNSGTNSSPSVSSSRSSPSLVVSTTWCSQDDLNEPTQIVFINEVAWAGNASSTSEEWIELYTDIGGGLSLSNWQLLDKNGEIQILFQDEDIEDYLLLRRILSSDDPSGTYLIGDTQSDINFTGTIQNEDETLRLFDASCNLVDEVIDVGSSWGNIGGSASPTYESAERIDSVTWGTYVGEEGAIMGTPKKINSLLEELEEENDQEEDINEEEPAEEEPAEEEEPVEEDVDVVSVSLEIDNVIFDVVGSDEGSERVSVINNGTSTVSLETYSIQYLKLDGDFSSIAKKNFENGHSIEERFVIGMNCSSDFPCDGVDMSWSQSLGNDGGTVYIVLNQENLEDDLDVDIHDSFIYSLDVVEDP